MANTTPTDRDFEVYYKDGTQETFSTSQLAYRFDKSTLAYVDFPAQHLSEAMQTKAPILLLKKPARNKSQKTPFPNRLEVILDTTFIKKIKFLTTY